MTIRGGGNPILDMACVPRFRMGPPPWSFAADAYDCIMVQLAKSRPDTSLWRDVRALMANSPRTVSRRAPPVTDWKHNPTERQTGSTARATQETCQSRLTIGGRYSQTSHP